MSAKRENESRDRNAKHLRTFAHCGRDARGPRQSLDHGLNMPHSRES
jgi:hypothetical protein